jgi:hypothetical protein
MAVPAVAIYSVAVLAAAHMAFLEVFDAVPFPGTIKIRDSADVLLATIPLAYPSGAVNQATGRLTFAIAGREENAPTGGMAAYGEFCDPYGVVHLALPTQAGLLPVSGKLVINSLVIVGGGPVSVVSATIG